MREKLFTNLRKVYAVTMSIAFFGGFIPVPFYIISLFVGPSMEGILVFLQKQYFPYIIALASISVLIGLFAMYAGKIEGLSIKSMAAQDSDSQTMSLKDAKAMEKAEKTEE